MHQPENNGLRVIWHAQNALKHFLTTRHCNSLEMKFNHTDTLATMVQTSKDLKVFATDIPQAIIDDAIITCSRKSLSLTAIPVVLNVASRALLTCRGKERIPVNVLNKLRKDLPQVSRILTRLDAAVESVRTRSGVRARCRLGRGAITQRLRKLAEMTLQQKSKFLKTCQYLSMSCRYV